MSNPHNVTKSWELFDEARQLIPLGTGTNSKAPKYRGHEPAYIVRAQGGHVEDIDGNRYLDFRNALGPITLGHAYPPVQQAIAEELPNGVIQSWPHPLEVEVARKLTGMIPAAEQVRYLKTGGEAMAAAIKLARAYTGRDLLLTCGYHGWLQTVANQPGVPRDVADKVKNYEYGDIDQVEQLLDQHAGQVAAVTISGNYRRLQEQDTFAQRLRELTQKHDVLLIVDEIVTGFRLAWGGWAQYYGITPDLSVFGKGLANGMPMSVYLGRRDVMAMAEQGAVISSTFSGETLSLAATKATLAVYEQEPVIDRLWALGRRLRDGIGSIFAQRRLPARITGLPPCPRLALAEDDPHIETPQLRAALFSRLADHGVLFHDVPYVNYSHTEADIDQTLEHLDQACSEIDPANLPDFNAQPSTQPIGAAS